jgi:cytochrome c553
MWRAIILAAAVIGPGCSAPVTAPLPASGELIAFGGGPGGPADACFTCHGVQGEGDGLAPRLSGLSRGYLIKQLEDYGDRWRDDRSMSPIARRLSDADRMAVSDYYADKLLPAGDLPASLAGHPLYAEGDPVRGLEPCSVCHDESGRKFGLATPALTGQTQAYIRGQLIAWKESSRRNDPGDIMGAIARKLSYVEIDEIAAHVGLFR